MGSVRDDDATASWTAAAAALGWIATGLVNVVGSAALAGGGSESLAAGAVAHAIDLGRHVAAGLLCGGAVWLWGRFGPQSRAATWAAFVVAVVGVGMLVMSEDAAGFAGRVSESTGLPTGPLQIAVVVAGSLAIPVAWFATQWVAQQRLGLPAVLVVAAVVYGLNTRLWQQDNPGLHFFMSWCTATILGAAARDQMRRSQARLVPAIAARPPWIDRALLSTLGVWALLATVLPPSNSLKIQMKGWSANLQALSLSRSGPAETPVDAPTLREEQRGFFVDRTDGPRVPPSEPRLIQGDPIVIVLTVDALRYDVVADPKYAASVPNLRALAEAGARFEQARSPGAQTVNTLSAFSTGKYFSQLYWKKYKTDIWLHDDPSEHLAGVLTRAGVTTIAVPGASWLSDEYGILRGFAKGKYRKSKHKWSHGEDLTKRLNSALAKYATRGPLFMYCHYFDPHSPYDRGTLTEGDAFDRYLSEVQMVDTQIGLVMDKIDALGIWDRTLLVVSADHGEAFGEHGVQQRHSVNLYDELIHVPLLARGAGVIPRDIEALVSVIDLGPTVLDIFGVPTPSAFMGQSLVPLLRGEDPELTRPIVSEGRLKQAMVFPSGIKVVVDPREDTVEVYDLKADPKELNNLSDEIDLAQSNEYRMLRKFFSVHTYKREGYEAPLRK